jgi:hypothetical protein
MEYSKCYTLKELVDDCRSIFNEEQEFAKSIYDLHNGEFFLKEAAVLNIVG